MIIPDSVKLTGEIEQRPYTRAVVVLAIAALLSHMLTAPAVTAQVGILPFLLTQAVLLWWWFALSVKRLNNAERNMAGVSAVAFICLISLVLLGLMLLLQFNDPAAGAAAPWIPASFALLIYPFVFVFNAVTGPAANAQDLTVAILALFTLAPPLLAIWYSVWAALQPAELHAHP